MCLPSEAGTAFDVGLGVVIGQQRGPAATRGRLHIFLGATPGAGKTYAMLTAGGRCAAAGDDVVVVVVVLVETHGREDLRRTVEANGLDIIPPRRINYRGVDFEEPDYDAVRARHPDLVVLDELAHTTVPGSRHA